ncbi:MAG TPA: hypothetical protein VFV28_10375 [Limnobacter sp.]|nr:hypothetical protein [Limnobacter sp.]
MSTAHADECWINHTPQVHEWVCAGKSLPEDSQAFALSILVVESPRALMVVDSGATAVVGEQAALAIQNRFGNRPLWILNTQPKPEHVLGNVGFRKVLQKNLPVGESFSNRIVAGKQTAELMQARCPKCIENFSERMGSASVAGTEPVVPSRLLKSESGNLGVLQSEFRSWKYRLYKNLETEETLVLRNPDLKIWWVGSAVQKTGIPDLYEGSVIQRIEFLSRLKSQMKTDDTVLTSSGVAQVDMIQRNLDYFVKVQQEVLYGLENGVSEVELIQQISQGINQFQAGEGMTQDLKMDAKVLETHQLNIQRIFRQTEPFAF